jgi:hypothetical protein
MPVFSHMLLMYVAAFTHVPTRDERVRLSFKSFRLTQTESTKSFFFFLVRNSQYFLELLANSKFEKEFQIWASSGTFSFPLPTPIFSHVCANIVSSHFFVRSGIGILIKLEVSRAQFYKQNSEFRSSCGVVRLCPLRFCIKLQLDLFAKVPSGALNIGTSLSIHCWICGVLQ